MNSRRPLPVAVGLLGLLVVFMLAGVLPARGGGQEAVFRTPVFIVLLAALGLLLGLCCRRRLHSGSLGFLAVHAGVAVILAGALAGFVKGISVDNLRAPVVGGHEISELRLDEKETVPLGFRLSVTNFQVTFFPPHYNVFRPRPGIAKPAQPEDYEFARRVRPGPDGSLDLGESERLEAKRLKALDDPGASPGTISLDNGVIVQKGRAMPSHYSADVVLRDPDGAVAEHKLEVNRPVDHRGWRFYLMSYETHMGHSILLLTARRDPGRGLVIAGIWLVIAGTAILCFRQGRTRASAARKAEIHA